jgi:hypothetical protein
VKAAITRQVRVLFVLSKSDQKSFPVTGSNQELRDAVQVALGQGKCRSTLRIADLNTGDGAFRRAFIQSPV